MKNVLYVEDDKDSYCFIEKLLQKKGSEYTIIKAVNGMEAIEKAKNMHIDVILMDIRMPVMNGIEATKRIRLFNNDIPIIAYTADINILYSDNEKLFTDIIIKPADIKEIYRKVITHTEK